MSSDFSQLPDFNQQQQYQQYAPPPAQKSRSGCLGLSFVAVLGGGCALILLCCVCCVGVLYLAFQEPTVVAQAWGTAITDPANYDQMSFFVCSGSQAETYTNNLESANAYFTTNSFTTGTSTGDSINVSGTLVRNGESEFWSAVITTDSGGLFGRCISQIQEN
jgi:hypothetical protein